MPRRNTLTLAVVICVAVLAGLAGVGGTWALWNASAPTGAGTVRAADFRVEVDGSPLVVDGVSATVHLADPATALTPTTPVYARLVLTNATDAGGPFRIRAALGNHAVSNATDPGLAAALTVRSAPAPPSGICAEATYSPEPAAAVVGKGESATVCLRTSLAPGAPGSLMGDSATVTVPVIASQLPEGP